MKIYFILNFLIENKDRFNSIILRYFNVAGADPDLRSGLISNEATHLIKILSEVAVGKREKIFIYGNDYKTKDGTAIRDYIHVSDLADIHLEVSKYLNEKKISKSTARSKRAVTRKSGNPFDKFWGLQATVAWFRYSHSLPAAVGFRVCDY